MLETMIRGEFTSQSKHRPMQYNEFGYQQQYNCVHDIMKSPINCIYCRAEMSNSMRVLGDQSPTNSDVLQSTYGNGTIAERFDFSTSEPHLNYDLIKPDGGLLEKRTKKWLDDAHSIPLFKNKFEVE